MGLQTITARNLGKTPKFSPRNPGESQKFRESRKFLENSGKFLKYSELILNRFRSILRVCTFPILCESACTRIISHINTRLQQVKLTIYREVVHDHK